MVQQQVQDAEEDGFKTERMDWTGLDWTEDQPGRRKNKLGGL